MVEGSYCTMFGTGLVVSWVYLRFYQVRQQIRALFTQTICFQVHSNGSRGDFADSFAFATLFPNVLQVRYTTSLNKLIIVSMLQPPVSVLSNTVFSMLVKCRLCKKPVRRYDVGAPAGKIDDTLKHAMTGAL